MPNGTNGHTEASRAPEPGRFGAASTNSYTFGFWLAAMVALGGYARDDLLDTGAHRILSTLALESKGWAICWLIALYVASTQTVVMAASIYHQYTGRTFVDDRIGFARSGGQDIATMCGLLVGVTGLGVMHLWMPAVVPAWIRVPLLLIVTVVVGNLLVAALCRRTYDVLYGGPIPR